MTEIYGAKLSALYDGALYEKTFDSLPKWRKDQVTLLKKQDDRIRCTGTFCLLRFAVEKRGYSADKIKFLFGEYGKPYVADNSFFFNLSHSGEYALCAVSEGDVGCDIETVGKYRNKTAKRFFTVDEYALLSGISDEENRNKMFFSLWTLKESVIKATGMGAAMGFSSFSVADEKGIFDRITVGEREYSIALYEPFADCRSGICCVGAPPERIIEAELFI